MRLVTSRGVFLKIIWKRQRKAASMRFNAIILIIMALVFGILLYTLSMVYFSQYYLKVTGGNNPTGQGWYDGGTGLTLTSDWVWGGKLLVSRGLP
jgi:hypothetical protein